jgi:hypothetical protein
MPTEDEIEELLDNCTSEWTWIYGVYGMMFTSNINGNSIFLPAAGFRWDSSYVCPDSWGSYWSSTLHPDGSGYAYYFNFGSDDLHWDDYDARCFGYSVRPVVRN